MNKNPMLVDNRQVTIQGSDKESATILDSILGRI